MVTEHPHHKARALPCSMERAATSLSKSIECQLLLLLQPGALKGLWHVACQASAHRVSMARLRGNRPADPVQRKRSTEEIGGNMCMGNLHGREPRLKRPKGNSSGPLTRPTSQAASPRILRTILGTAPSPALAWKSQEARRHCR